MGRLLDLLMEIARQTGSHRNNFTIVHEEQSYPELVVVQRGVIGK